MMRLITGQLAATSNPNIATVIATNPTAKIIFVGDTVGYENLISIYSMVPATVLVPDYYAMEAYIDNNYQAFLQYYSASLCKEPALSYFVTIMAALHQGKNILLFFPPEATELGYPEALLEYIRVTYGIQATTETVPFAYAETYTLQNANLLYEYNLIDAARYLLITGEQFNNIQKLVNDLCIPISPNTSQVEIYNYLNDYRKRMISNGSIMIRPFSREV